MSSQQRRLGVFQVSRAKCPLLLVLLLLADIIVLHSCSSGIINSVCMVKRAFMRKRSNDKCIAIALNPAMTAHV